MPFQVNFIRRRCGPWGSTEPAEFAGYVEQEAGRGVDTSDSVTTEFQRRAYLAHHNECTRIS